jgi:hypothetical protein
MTIFRLVSFEEGRSITVQSDTTWFGRVVVSYVAEPTHSDRTRLLVKLAFRRPPGISGWIRGKILPVGDLVMMRKQLLTLKTLAERDARSGSTI